jgi:ribosomal protein L44E
MFGRGWPSPRLKKHFELLRLGPSEPSRMPKPSERTMLNGQRESNRIEIGIGNVSRRFNKWQREKEKKKKTYQILTILRMRSIDKKKRISNIINKYPINILLARP